MKLKIKSSLPKITFLLLICLFLIPTISKIYIISTTQKNINRNLEPKLNAPTIIIIAPTNNQLFGISAPNYNVDITDPSGVNTTWYTIDGGLTNYTFTGTNGAINQGVWDGRPNGTVTIRFYANNTLGEESASQVTIRRDILAPSIIIISPTTNQLFSSIPPTFNLTIVEGNLDTTWYTLDGGAINYTFTGTSGTINQGRWDDRPNGIVTIRFYAFDTQGNLNYSEVSVLKSILAQTDIAIISFYDTLIRKDGLNQTVIFYFNDTANNLPVLNVITANIVVKNYATGTPFNDGEFLLLDLFSNGTYILDITMGTRNSGWYTLEINASKFPNYGSSVTYITFYLRGNYTAINLISLSDPGGALSPIGLRNFTIFEGSYLDIEFNITDSEYFDNLIIGDADSYTVRYTNLDTGSNGILFANLNFITQLHTGTIFTSNPDLTIGRYSLNITTSRTNYEDATFIFNLTVIERYQVRVNFTYLREVDAGVLFTIVVKAEFLNGTVWFPLEDCNVMLRPYFNDNPSTIQTLVTNSTGEVLFVITVLGNTITMNLMIQLLENYYHVGDIFPISDIEVIPLPPGLAFEDLLPYFIIIGAVIAVAAGSIIGYWRIISPKKRKMPSVLEGVKTIFDDAFNLEHLFVLFKRTGTCILFKSFVSEEIHPILISGFISEICSFGKDLEYQEKVNKITYDDKKLLLSDGEYVRVALVLNKKVSMFLYRNLIEFVNTFERIYSNELLNWRWQFNVFINVGTLIDEKLGTSINLPHEIAYNISSIKPLRNPYSKDVLKIANELVEESERNFLTITTLLKEATEKTRRDTKEIFMGIKELRDKKILIPIEIDTIEAQPITQEEMTVINQKVAALANLTPEEKKKLVDNLAQTGSAERGVYLVSLMEQREIISAPIEEKLGVTIIDNVKRAKKEINNLKKIGQLARNEKDYEKAINIYRKALKIATEYELVRELDQINEFIQSTESEKYFDLEES